MEIVCPECSSKLRGNSSVVRKHATCPNCGALIHISDTEGVSSAPLVPTGELAPFQYDPTLDKPRPRSAIETGLLPDPNLNRVSTVYRDEFICIGPDGSADFNLSCLEDAIHVLRVLKTVKRRFRLEIRALNASLRDVRHDYTDYSRRRIPNLGGFGDAGKLIRLAQTLFSEYKQFQLADSVEPLHEQRQRFDRAIIELEHHILQTEAYIYKARISESG